MKGTTKMLLLSLVISACSHKAADKRVAENGIADEAMRDSPYTALQFEKGNSKLTFENKKFLNDLAQRATRPGFEITEIKVLSWADREYPSKSAEKTRKKDIVLARERSKVVTKYIRNELHSDDRIKTFNMAEKPSPLDKFTKNAEFSVKQDVAQSGVSATRLPSGETSWTKAGKVIVIIDYKSETK